MTECQMTHVDQCQAQLTACAINHLNPTLVVGIGRNKPTSFLDQVL